MGRNPSGYAALGEDAPERSETPQPEIEMTHAGSNPAAALPSVVDVELERVGTPAAGSSRNSGRDSGSRKPSPPIPYKSSESDDDDSDIEVFPPSQPMTPRGLHLATLAQKRALWWRNVFITTMFILSWYAFATLLSIYNKWMFSKEYYGFSYPLFVTACHMGVQFICAAFIRIVFSDKFRPVERPTRRDYAMRIFPTAVTTGTDIGLSNLSLKTITLSLYTMCKSSALIFVLIFAFMFRLEKYSLRLVSVILLITFGVFLMVFNTTEVSIPGIVMVFSASAVGGLRWSLTELIMHKKAMGLSNPFATIFWLAPLMGVVLLIVSACIESWKEMFLSSYFSNPLVAFKTIAIIIAPGACAFAMVASEYFVIQRAGVVPLSIAGIFKEVTTISFSAWIFGDELTGLNIVGVVITVCGIALYSFHKYQKSMKRDVHLDAADNPIDENDERAPLYVHHRSHSRATSAGGSTRTIHSRTTSLGESPTAGRVLQLQPLDREAGEDETHDDRVNRLRDEFEGWDSVNVDSEGEAESDVDDEEVMRRRNDKTGARSRWARFWDADM